MLAAFACAPLAVLILRDIVEQVIVALVGGRLVIAGTTRLLASARLDAGRLRLAGPLRTHLIPWQRLYSARQDGEHLLVD